MKIPRKNSTSRSSIVRLSTWLLIPCLMAACNSSDKGVVVITDKEVKDGLTYTKDKHGLCYAVMESDTASGHKVRSIAAVPCNKVGL